MDKIKSQYFHQLHNVQSRMQNIVNQLDKFPKTQKKFHHLSRDFHEAFKELNAIKEKFTTIFTQGAADALEQQLRHSYHRFIDSRMKSEVETINRRAMSLEHSLEQGNVTKDAVKKLSKRLDTFRNSNQPLSPERQILANAKKTVDRANAFLKGSPVHAQVRAVAHSTPPSAESVALAFDLFDISVMLYNRQIQKAKIKCLELPPEQMERFEEHMRYLKATPFTDCFESAQAFFAMATELTGSGEGYPSHAEIESFISDINQVVAQDTNAGRIFSLSSHESFGG